MKLNRYFSANNVSQIIALFSLLALVFTVYANRVDDLDLWWHLKSGEKIVQDRSIATQDTFSFTTITPKNLQGVGRAGGSSFKYWNANLSQSWMGQVIFYCAFILAGLKGIGLLKSSIFVLTYLILYLAMLRRGANSIIAFLVLALIAYIGMDFNYSRPPIFSFLSFSLLFYIFVDF